MNWYEKYPRKVHFDMHSPMNIESIGKGLNIEDYAKQIKKSGADALVVFAKCAYGWTYFDNDYIPRHPNLLDQNLFGTIRQGLKEKGIETVAYFSTVSLSKKVLELHPEWAGRHADGSMIEHDEVKDIALTCVNSDYWEDAYIPMLRQLVEKQGIGAIWMDGYYQLFNHPCHCEKCQKDYGKAIPRDKEDLNWRPYFHYINKKLTGLLEKIKIAVREINPECCIGGDWIGSVMWGQPVPEALDFFSCDVHVVNGSFNTAFVSAAWSWREQVVDVYSQRMYWWQDFNTRPVESVILDQAVNIASGGIFMIGDVVTPYNLKVHSEQSRYYKAVFDALNPLYENTRDSKSVAEIAMLVGVEDTRSYGAKWTTEVAKHKGMYSAIIEGGYAAHILYESDLKKYLENYKLLVVCEATYMGSEAAQVIKSFVESGGKLIVVGTLPAILNAETIYTEGSVDKKLFEDLVGVEWVTDEKESIGFFDVYETPFEMLWGDKLSKLPERVEGLISKCRIRDSILLCPLTAPGDSFQIGAKVSGQVTDYVAFTQKEVGEGCVMYSALPLASNAWNNGHAGSYHAIQSMINGILESHAYKVNGPSNVQLFPLIGEGERYTLIAHQQAAQECSMRQMMRPGKIAEVKLEIRGEITSAVDVITGDKLKVTINKGISSIDVPNFSIWTTIGVKR